MKLQKLIENIYKNKLSPDVLGREVVSICCDSRKAEKGSLFIALEGETGDGYDFISDAVSRGATTVAVSKDKDTASLPESATSLIFDDIDSAFRELVQRFYGADKKKINIIGITGTNGKTSVAYLLESIFEHAGKKCGVIGTINHRLGNERVESHNTTPGYLENHQLLAHMAGEEADYCFMEVSSHALVQGRVRDIDFKRGVFTNLTSDHLDYHKTRENYFEAKTRLFTGLSGESSAIINCDDAYGQELITLVSCLVLTYGIDNQAFLTAQDIHTDHMGSSLRLVSPQGEADLKTLLIGKHNIYNILAAATVGLAEGIAIESIADAINKFKNVPGRLERVENSKEVQVFIDYAHTQDALENVLSTLKPLCRGKLICVFGCGGNRDKSKRPAMGKVADELADYTVITSDNSRGEESEDIISQIEKGFKGEQYEIIIDRKEAIEAALKMAKKEDIVLIAGKGHEKYQVIKDKKTPFDERKIIEETLT